MASSNQFQDLPATLGRRLQELKKNPSAISAIASLGLHGLLFILLPLLPYASIKATEPEIKESVAVLELTPEEQKRLPDFPATPSIELPPIAEPPKTNSSDLFSLSDIPKASAPSTSDSLLTPPLPIFIPPAPPVQIPSFSIPIPTTPIRPAPQAAPSPAPQSSQSPTPSPSASAEPTPVPSVAVEPGPESPQAEANAEPSPAPRTQEQIRQDLVARQQELRELYTYNPAGTSVGAAQTTFADWFYEKLGKTGEDFDNRKQVEVAAEYPKLACPLKQTRTAVVGAMVDADNKIVGEPKIVQSSGYQLFNQEALNAIQSYEFDNSIGAEQLFLVTFKFNYNEEICPRGLTPATPAG